jgi:mono/diheme cytochrome c family protein
VVFTTHCAACHGGKKWTKSRTAPLFQNNPTFAVNPIGPAFFDAVTGAPNSVLPIDVLVPDGTDGLSAKGPQILAMKRAGKGTLTLLDRVGTFNPAGPLELRGAAAVAGQSTQGFGAFGLDGFNSPSLLGLSLSAPYLHDGSAATLEEVMGRHLLLTSGKAIEDTLDSQQLADVLAFIRNIDEGTATVESDTDRFLQ